jgi:hypothetical protein
VILRSTDIAAALRDTRSHLAPRRRSPRLQRGFFTMPGGLGINRPSGSSGPPDPDFADVEILIQPNGPDGSTAFVDQSSHARTITPNGAAQMDTAQQLYCPASTLLDGAGDYLTFTTLNGFSLSSALWCFEGWLYFNSFGGAAVFVSGGLSGNGFYILWVAGSIFMGDGATNNIAVANTPATGSWHHWAGTFDATTYRLFFDGTLLGSSTTTLAATSLTNWELGSRTGQAWYLDGHVGPFRMSLGTARYTAAFTPPTAAFPTF